MLIAGNKNRRASSMVVMIANISGIPARPQFGLTVILSYSHPALGVLSGRQPRSGEMYIARLAHPSCPLAN